MNTIDAAKASAAIDATATNLEANRQRVQRLVDEWSTALAHSGDGGPTSGGVHSDPTIAAALAHDPLREIDTKWATALAVASGWCRNVLGPDTPNDLARRLHLAAVVVATGQVGSMQVQRLYVACCTLDDIIGACRPRYDEPEEEKPAEPRTCVACLSQHTGSRPKCDACRKLHQRTPEYDDDEFARWVQRRIREGSLSRPSSALHHGDAA